MVKDSQEILQDLKVANEIQKNFLPRPLVNKDIHIEGVYLPIQFLGGDLYYWQQVDEHKYVVVLLDIMGHGTSTAMIGMHIRTLLPEIIHRHQDPLGFMKQLNSLIMQVNGALSGQNYHCTAFYMVIDTVNKCIDYVNAAHPDAVLFKTDNTIEKLDMGCIPIGIFEDLDVEVGSIEYASGNRLFLYSDGIFDMIREGQLNLDYMYNYVKYYGDLKLDTQDTLDKLSAFLEVLNRSDDVSMVFIEFMEGA